MRNSAKKLVAMIGLLLLCPLLTPANAPARDTAYVDDTLIIGLRQSPDSKSSIVKTLQSNDVLEILERQDKFLRVRTAAGAEGWLPQQYVTSQPPKTQIIAELKAEVQAIQAQYDKAKIELDKGKNQDRGELTATTQQLAEMTERYNTLRDQSTHVTELAQENENLRAAKAKLTMDMESLRQDSTHLKRTDMIPWFLAGAGVFLAGFIIARLGNKKKSFY